MISFFCRTKSRFALLINLLFICIYINPTFAQENNSIKIQDLYIDAEEFLQNRENDTIQLKGKIQIIYKNNHLKCQKALVNLRTKTIEAYENVVITTDKAEIGGVKITIDYENDTGIIYAGYVKSGTVLFEGDIIHKTGDSDYLASQAKYTTCTTCPEAWSFHGSNIRAQLGGYAYIKNSLLRVGSFPIFWMPYLIVPLKSDRQTGLLTPEFEFSDTGGLTISQPFFWAISENQDATITLKNYEKRGLKSLLEYRYMLTENSYGELHASLLQDKAFINDNRLNQFRPIDKRYSVLNRWFLKYDHYYDLPEDWISRVQLNNASDLQYSKDFPLETLNHGDSAMENRISLTRNTFNTHFSIDSSYYINMLSSNPLNNNNFSVHRLPEFKFSKTQTKLFDSSFPYSFDSYYVNFYRPSLAYDNLSDKYDPQVTNNIFLEAAGASPECLTQDWEKDEKCKAFLDGKFDIEKDLIRTGQRLDINPSIYFPININPYFDIQNKLSYRETYYAFDLPTNTKNSAQKRQMRFDTSIKTTFGKVYGNDKLEIEEKEVQYSTQKIKHEIIPELSATVVPWIYQSKHPFFGSANPDDAFFSNQENISDADLYSPYSLQFDYTDRTYNRKKITFSITNKFTEKTWVNDQPKYQQFLIWKISQSFDAYLAERNSKQPLSDVLSDLSINLNNLQVYQRANYFPYHYVTNTSTRIRLINDKNEFIQMAHILSYNISPNSIVDKSNRTEDITLSGRKNYKILELLGKLTYDLNPNEEEARLKSYGYGAQIKLPGECWYLNLIQYKITGGGTDIKINFSFIWDGEPKSSLPNSILDIYGF